MPSIIKPNDILNLDYDLPSDVRCNFTRAAADSVFSQRLAVRGLTPVATRTHFPFNGASSGSSQTVTYRTTHMTRSTGRVTFLRLVYANSSISASGEIPGTHPFTVKAAIEYNGASYPVYFNGSRTKLLAIDEQVISDPIMISLPASTTFYVRSNALAATLGDKWPLSNGLLTSIGESYTASDVTDSVASMGAFAANGFGPAAILGSMAGDNYSVLVTGSSSGWGQGDTAEASNYDFGYLSRALSVNHGYLKCTRASTTILQFLTTHSRQLQFMYNTKPTHVVQQLGSNDISNGASVAVMKQRLQDIWGILGSTGAKVYQCTATPNTTSSDNWATLAGQTKNGNNDVRVEVNEWIRSKPAGLDGVVECCNVVESSYNSGLWAVNGAASAYTADGLHLTQMAHRLTAATIDFNTILSA